MLVSYWTEGNSALSESRKNDKIASSVVARPHVNGITLLGCVPMPSKIRENSEARKLPSGNCINCERRDHDNRILQLVEYKCSMYRLMRHGTSSAGRGRT